MKFKFAFEKVLKHRKTLEEVAQTEYLEALADLNQEVDKLNQLQATLEESRRFSFETQNSGGQAGSALSQVFDFQKGQDVRIERQRKVIGEHEIKVEKLQEILRLKAIDYKIIDKLKGKKKEEFRVQENKKDQKRIDDLNVMRFKKDTT